MPGYELAFPRDEGSHPDYRIEWWYVTGQLDDGASKVKAPRGFQVTFFRVRTGLAADNPSSFAPRQVLFAHAAIADPAHRQAASRAAQRAHGIRPGVCARGPAWTCSWTTGRSGRWRPASTSRSCHGEDFDFDLTLASTQPPLLQGERGFSRKGPDPLAASYYYSLPQLAVTGEVTVDGRTRNVSGQAWFDHEWSSDYVDESALGWDWLGVNMTDGGALMAFRMRDRQGGARWAGATLRVRRTRAPEPGRRVTTFGPEAVRLDTAAVLAFAADRGDVPGPVARAGR